MRLLCVAALLLLASCGGHYSDFTLPELTTLGFRPRPGWMVSKANTLDWWEGNHISSNHTFLVKTFTF